MKCVDELDDKAGAWLIFSGWWLMGLVVVIMFMLSGVVMPVAMVLSDTCAVLKEFPSDMQGFLGPTMGGSGKETGTGDDSGTAAEIIVEDGSGAEGRRRRRGRRASSLDSKDDSGTGGAAMNPASLLIGCYNQKSLLETLNMSTRFSFTGSLNFSALDAFDPRRRSTYAARQNS